MLVASPSRSRLNAVLVAGMAVVLGALAAIHPSYGVAVAAVALVTLLAFVAPVTHLTILIALTALVPYSLEGKYHLGGAGAGNGGLQASDLFLLTGLLRAALVLPRLRLSRRQLTVLLLVVLFCAITVFEAWQGLRADRGLSNVGSEFRALAGGVACSLIATVILERGKSHRAMLRALVVLGLALGLIGIAQWTLGLSFGGDFGVRSGVSLTTNGVGQLQGGLYSFPVAVVIAAAVLASGQLRNWRERTLVWAVLAVNVVSLLLTFERTFWVATGIALVIVALRSGRRRRVRAVLALTFVAVIGIGGLAVVSPNTFTTAEQRLLSIGDYQTDNSVRYRDVESTYVIAKIDAEPLLGWGLADTVFWGQPWQHDPPSAEAYTHVGYLWLLWRYGAIGCLPLFLLLLLSALWPGRARAGDLMHAVKVGCQASIIVFLIVDVTFPPFQGSEATYVIGLLFAYCALPSLRRHVPPPPRGAPANTRGPAPRSALAGAASSSP